MSVPTWLNQATPNSSGENGSQIPAGAASLSFSRPPTTPSFDPSQMQYQQMQLQMQNGSMRHAPPSTQSPMYNTQNLVPSKRSRPRGGSIGALPQSFSGGPPGPHLQMLQGAYPGSQGAVHGGPRFGSPAAYQQFPQQHNNPKQPPMIQHQRFNPPGPGPVTHGPPPSSFLPAGQAFAAKDTTSQSEPIRQLNANQGGGQLYSPYGTSQARTDPSASATNHMAIPQFTNPQKWNPQEQQMYMAARAQQMRHGEPDIQLQGMNISQLQQISPNNPEGRSLNSTTNHHMAQTQEQVQGQPNSIRTESRPNHLDRLLRSMVQYMHSRKLPFDPRPIIAAKSTSCVNIFLSGMKFGGSRKIQRRGQWPRIAQSLAFPHSKFNAAGQEIQMYWDRNLAQWESHFVQLQQSKSPRWQSHTQSEPPFGRQRRRKIMRTNMKATNRSQNIKPSITQVSLSSTKRPRAPHGQPRTQPPGKLPKATSLDLVARHISQNDIKSQQKFHLPKKQSNGHGPRTLGKQHELHHRRTRNRIARPKATSMGAISKGNKFKKANSHDKSKYIFVKIKSKDVLSRLIAEGAFRERKAKDSVPIIKPKDTTLIVMKAKNKSLGKLRGPLRRKRTRTKKPSQEHLAGHVLPKKQSIVKDVGPKLGAKGISSTKVGKEPFPKMVAKAYIAKGSAANSITNTRNTIGVAIAGNSSTAIRGKTTLSIGLPSPRPVPSVYLPNLHTYGESQGPRPSQKPLRTVYHGGLPISDPWFKDTLDVLVKFKHSTPQLNELGVVDIQALILSLRSGINGEVRLALDVIAALSHARPPPLTECEELLDTLIDFGSDQINMLAESSSKSSNFVQLPSQQKQLRGFKTQSYGLQEVPDIGSRYYDLDRAAHRLISVTTILRNLSLRSDNRESLREPSIIRMLTTVVRYLGTRDLFLRTHQNALDFSKDVVTFLSALAPYLNLTSKEDGLAVLQFLLSFAPEPKSSVQGEKTTFAFYEPMIHRYLPHAVNALAKLIARDPNRTLYRSIFASESASSPPFNLLTRAFGLAVCTIPEVSHHRSRGKGIIATRSPIIAQGLLSAEILMGMLPMSAHEIAYSWLGSQDCLVSRLVALLSLISKTTATASRQRPDGRLRTAYNMRLEYRVLYARGLLLLRKLAERAQDAAAFATDFSPEVFRLKQSVSRASGSTRES